MAKSHKRTRGPGAPTKLLLDYLVSTAPQPLQISTTTRPAAGTIDIYVSEPGKPVYCNEIVIAVMVGDDPGCLFAQPPTGAVNTGKWAQTSFEIVDGPSLGLSAGAYAKFVYDCQTGADFDITYNLVFSLTGTLANQVGDSAILVLETAGTVNNPSQFQTNQGQFSAPLALPQFYLNNFVATVTGSPTVPCTEFANGVAINLAWESNGTWFQLFKKGEATSLYAGAATNYTLTPGVATDTTFFLVASMTGNPSGDQPVAGYRTVYLYDALAITISDPDLTPKSVAIGTSPPTGVALGVAGDIQATGHIQTTGPISGVGICPPGTVIMFSGNIGDQSKFDAQGTGVAGTPYAGWQLCNGVNGAPDLRNKFIAGAGGQYQVGTAGGADSIVLTDQQIPAHNHGGATGGAAPYLNYCGVYYCSKGVSTGIMVNVQTEDPNGYRPNMLTTRGMAEIQVNNHTHTIAPEGGGGAHENRPQFYALAYLMRL